MKTATREAKQWYLKAGSKQVGPMTATRVRERLAQGKIPGRARAWREGMDEWDYIKDIPELSDRVEAGDVGADGSDSSSEAPARANGAKSKTVALPKKRPSRDGHRTAPQKSPAAKKQNAVVRAPVKGKGSLDKANAKARPAPKKSGGIMGFLFPDELPLTFEQPYRMERKDMTGAFGLAMSVPRVKLLTLTMFVACCLALAPLAATFVHIILGGLVGLVCAPLSYVFIQIAMGALSYQTRRQIETGETPSPTEALGFAKRHGLALAITPVLVGFLTGVPIVILGVLSALDLIPVVGPIFNGLIFGVHIALSAAALFLLVASSLIWVFGPVIVAFEESGVIATIKILFDLVRRSFVRLILWSLWPQFVYLFFAIAVLSVGATVIGVPLGIHTTLGGASAALGGAAIAPSPSFDDVDWENMDLEDMESFNDSGSDAGFASSAGATAIGGGMIAAAIPTALWTALAVAAVIALLASAQNAITCLLYLGGRRGNDDLPTRDAWIAARQLGAEQAPA